MYGWKWGDCGLSEIGVYVDNRTRGFMWVARSEDVCKEPGMEGVWVWVWVCINDCGDGSSVALPMLNPEFSG